MTEYKSTDPPVAPEGDAEVVLRTEGDLRDVLGPPLSDLIGRPLNWPFAVLRGGARFDQRPAPRPLPHRKQAS